MASSSNERKLKNLVINKVDSQATFDQMKKSGLINADELYLIKEGTKDRVLDVIVNGGSTVVDGISNFNVPTVVSELENDSGYITTAEETDPVFSVSAAAGITSNDIQNWNNKTSNIGTITGVSVNGTSIATSGVANITSVPASILTGAIPNGVTATTQTQSDNSTKIATTAYVDTAIGNLPEPMVFKGSLGTGGTITALPTAEASNEGHTYKVIKDGTYAGQAAKIGDTFISTGSRWELIPSGDEPSGTVTSITLNATSPIAIDNNAAITTSGTRTISHASSGVSAGTYKSVTVNSTGHVTDGTNPTTLSGYGITDAKIANGVITLGSNTITPLTEHQDISGKQDKLTTQTAYSAKGSATKVPQITTNTLGQVTGITEVTIAQPTVNNATLTIQKNGTNVATFGANANSNVTANITVPTVTDTYSAESSDAMSGKAVASALSSFSGGPKNIKDGDGTGSVYTSGANKPTADHAFAEGYGTQALEDCSHAEGQNSRAFGGWGAHAEGNETWAGDYGHSEGWATVAVSNSHAEGRDTVASDTSHAEGFGDRWLDPRNAICVDSFVVVDRYYQYPIFDPAVHTAKDWYEGCFLSKLSPSTYGDLDPYMCITYISKNDHSYHYGEANSHKVLDFEIGDTIYIYMPNAGALGFVSHSEGYNTIATGHYQHVQGKWNEIDKENKYADIVGNGPSKNNRSNAYTLDWDGNAWFAGNIKVGGTKYDDSNAKVINAIANLKDGDGTGSVYTSGTNKPNANYAFAEGAETQALENYSHAEGYSTISNGSASHAEGYGSFLTALDTTVHTPYDSTNKSIIIKGVTGAEDIINDYIIAGQAYLSANKGSVHPTYKIKQIDEVYGQDARTIIYFKETPLSDITNLAANAQVYLILIGSLASGQGAHAEGDSTIASGWGTHAEGYSTKALEWGAHAEGKLTIASGEGAHAEGLGTIASYQCQHVEGKYNKLGSYIHIVGNGVDNNNRSNAYTLDHSGNAWFAGDIKIGGTGYNDSNAKVINVIANLKDGDGKGSVYTSEAIKPIANYAFAEGLETEAQGICSHAEGCYSIASGKNSHAENGAEIGSATTYALGTITSISSDKKIFDISGMDMNLSYRGFQPFGKPKITAVNKDFTTNIITLTFEEAIDSYSVGQEIELTLKGNQAIGDSSHAEGIWTIAAEKGSHAEGYRTSTNREYQHVQGALNIPDSSSIFIIGNGYGNDKSNAMTVQYNGSLWVSNDIKVGGTKYDNATATVLTSENFHQYVDAYVQEILNRRY